MNNINANILFWVVFFFGVSIFHNTCFSQSKKKQILALNFKIDSVSQVIANERNDQKNTLNALEKQEFKSKQKMDSLQIELLKIEKQVKSSILENEIKNKEKNRLKNEIEKQKDSLKNIISTSSMKNTEHVFQKNIDEDENENKYKILYDSCEDNKGNCWKLYLCWDESLSDYSTVGTSDMLFTYFTNNNSNCPTETSYILKSDHGASDFTVWQYQDAKINIRVRMQLIETFFGYGLYDLNIKNKLTNSCLPKTLYRKL